VELDPGSSPRFTSRSLSVSSRARPRLNTLRDDRNHQTLALIIVLQHGQHLRPCFFLSNGGAAGRVSTSWLHASIPVLPTVALAWVFWKNVERCIAFNPKNAFDYNPA